VVLVVVHQMVLAVPVQAEVVVHMAMMVVMVVVMAAVAAVVPVVLVLMAAMLVVMVVLDFKYLQLSVILQHQ
jgi:hypothetical protein